MSSHLHNLCRHKSNHNTGCKIEKPSKSWDFNLPANVFETRLVLFSRVRTLLDFNYLSLFEHLKSMTPLNQQDDVARLQ